MELIEAAKFIAGELIKNKAKLVILSGSAVRGEENPNDLDIAAVFEAENPLLNNSYRRELIQSLEKEVGYEVDLVDYNERYINNLIEEYIRDPKRVCWYLSDVCFDSVREQWLGWPLAWIFGEEAERVLDPYLCFQTEFQVLEGNDYLEDLRSRIKSAEIVHVTN